MLSKPSTIELTEKNNSDKTKLGFVAAVIANILWGTSFLASKASLTAMGPLGASALRFMLASIILGAVLFIAKGGISTPKSFVDWMKIFAIAFAGFGILYPTQLMGLKFISSGFSAAIMLTSPLFVIIGGILFLDETLSRKKITAVILGIIGGLILLSESLLSTTGRINHDFVVGGGFTLLASLGLAASVILTRKVSCKLDAGSLTFWTMFIGAIGIGFCTYLFEPEFSLYSIRHISFAAGAALVFLAVVCSALCFFLWNFALSKASPREIASTMHIKTPIAILVGSFLAFETISATLIIGTAVVSLGVYLSQVQSERDQ